MKRAIDRGWIAGPRMVVSLEPISSTGGHSDPQDGIDSSWTNKDWGGSVADGPLEVTKEVREHRRRGAEVIKIMPSGGVLSNGDDPKAQTMTDEEIKAAIDTAHSLGLKVAAHAHSKGAIDNTVRLGVDSIEHGTYADQESFALMKEHGTYLVPTLLVADQILREVVAHPEMFSASSREKMKVVAPLMAGMLNGAYKAGVKIAFGTDIQRRQCPRICSYGESRNVAQGCSYCCDPERGRPAQYERQGWLCEGGLFRRFDCREWRSYS